MWPFKRKPVIDFRERTKTFEPAPCGEQHNHYHWTMIQGWPCPHCAAIEKVNQDMEKEKRMAKLIAQEIVKLNCKIQ